MSDRDPDCVFCSIVAGDLPGSFVYEDDRVVAFLDIRPVNPGHLMVIPRNHAPLLADVDEETGAHVFRVAHRLAQALRESGLRAEGVNLFLADGEAAFQEVPHLHLHVFPRFKGDTFKIDADWDTQAAREDLETAATAIRTAYAAHFGAA
ncbi:MAG: HIT family protein [Thermoplasmata archaeon]|nr:HIT family protein [Thermoplasmata archaeon]